MREAPAVSARNWCAILLHMGLLGGCSLPADHAMRQWADLASVAAHHSASCVAGPGSRHELAETLGIYFFALGVLAEDGVLTFNQDAYAGLLADVADPGTVGAMAEIGRLLVRARSEGRPQSSPSSLNDPAPPQIDRRLEELVRYGAGPVRLLLATLAQNACPEAERVLARISEGHMKVARLAGRWRQRESLRAIRAIEGELRLAVEMMPAAPLPDRGRLAAVLLP